MERGPLESSIGDWGTREGPRTLGRHVEALGTLCSTPLGMACAASLRGSLQWYPKETAVSSETECRTVFETFGQFRRQ